MAAHALRAFFRYAETRGWCATGFAKGIQGPKIYKYEGLPEGPSWEEVRKLLRSVKGSGAGCATSTGHPLVARDLWAAQW